MARIMTLAVLALPPAPPPPPLCCGGRAGPRALRQLADGWRPPRRRGARERPRGAHRRQRRGGGGRRRREPEPLHRRHRLTRGPRRPRARARMARRCGIGVRRSADAGAPRETAGGGLWEQARRVRIGISRGVDAGSTPVALGWLRAAPGGCVRAGGRFCWPGPLSCFCSAPCPSAFSRSPPLRLLCVFLLRVAVRGVPWSCVVRGLPSCRRPTRFGL